MIGVNYKIKNNVYIIDYEEQKKDKQYNYIVSTDFIHEIMRYNVDGNAYGIDEDILFDLLNKYSTTIPKFKTLKANTKQYIISYLHEKLPNDLYYFNDLLAFIETGYKNMSGRFDDLMSSELHRYLHMVFYKTYGSANTSSIQSIDNCNGESYLSDPLENKDSGYEFNTRVSIIIDTVAKYLKGETLTTFNDSKYSNIVSP